MSYIQNVTFRSLYSFIVLLNSVIHISENFALVGLTYVSSLENGNLHENLFVAFMVTSEIYMLVTCVLLKWSRSGYQMSLKDKRSFTLKVSLFVVNLASFLLAVYFYFRHNSHCEPGMYTLFGLMEYLTVISNIAFHWSMALDFEDKQICMIPVQDYTVNDKKHS